MYSPETAGQCCHLSVAQLAAMRRHGRQPSTPGSDAARVKAGPRPGAPVIEVCRRCLERLALNKADAGTQLTMDVQ